MLQIITNKADNVIDFVDEWFNENLVTSDFTETDHYILSCIDSATVVGNNEVRTLFGLCDINQVSTGSKTLISIIHFPDKVFNVSGCGANAIEILQQIAQTIDLKVYINFRLAISRWYGDISINGQPIRTIDEYRRWWYKYEEE